MNTDLDLRSLQGFSYRITLKKTKLINNRFVFVFTKKQKNVCKVFVSLSTMNCSDKSH
jgi:hypothetical protein